MRRLMVRYLLGELSDREREDLEKQYFIHQQAWEELEAVENDLIDAYVKEQLSSNERQLFESYFLRSERRRQRVEFARTLMDSKLRQETDAPGSAPVSSSPALRSPSRFWWSNARLPWFASAAALVLIAFLVWQNHRLQSQVGQLQFLQGQASDPATVPPAHNPEIAVISLALSPGLLRGSSPNNDLAKIHIGSAPSIVLLALSLERTSNSQFQLILQTPEGRVIQQMNGVHSKSSPDGTQIVTMIVPSSLLTTGDYIIKVVASNGRRSEILDSYAFSVIQ
jgi:hypothetical protein